MNTQTKKANEQRVENADAFALLVVKKLKNIENEYGYVFQSLNDRCVALNHLGFMTTRGSEWTKTQISRVLKRAENLSSH